MKIRIAYERVIGYYNPSIRVCISVADGMNDNIPTCIFKDKSDYPADENFKFKIGTTDTIEAHFFLSDEGLKASKEWVSKQVEALKEKLKEFRALELPEPQILTI